MRQRARTLIALSILALPALTQAAFAQGARNEGVIREGAGTRRAALNEMELKPFPSDLWSGVGAWAGGNALTPADTSGKPLLIITWASWYDPSVRALSAVEKVAQQYAADGLIVVGLHEDEGWEDAESAAKSRNLTFRLAHDKANAIRTALMVDQDPDIYVIDRAGQLRFADVDAASLEQAVRIVAKESAEDAAKINQTLADRARAERIRAQSTQDINQAADLTAIPELPFPEPPLEAYESARWPRVERQNNSYQQGPVLLALPQDSYYPPQVPATKGRAVVIYFWNPDVSATSNMVREMDLLQRQRGRDLVVIGSVVPRDRLTGSSGGYFSDPAAEATAIELLGRRTQEFAQSSRLSHPITFDPTATSMTGLEVSGTRNPNATLAAVASSDGVVRWFGDARTPSFKAAVQTVITNDPGIAARRAVEEAFLRNKGK